MMKKILFVSFYFPPTGVGGSIRSAKFVKYLPDFGIEPIVVTCSEKTYGVKDYSLLKGIPGNIRIERVSAFYLPDLMPKFKFLKLNQIISFIGRNFIWPDPAIYWAKKAFVRIKEILKKEKIDTIFTTGGPFSSHLIGLWLKKEFSSIFWIADFRDEWTSNPFMKYPIIRKLYEKKLEDNVFKNVDKVIVISQEMKKSFFLLHNLKEDKVAIIYNGFDEDDFKEYDFNSRQVNKNKSKKLKIVYSGTIYTLRNPKNLFIALRKLLDELSKNKDLNTQIEIDFIGHSSYYIKKGVKKFNLEKVVKILDRIAHENLFIKLIEYDIFLLLIGIGEKSKKILTGKLFEYLRMKKPILALGPEDSELSEIVKRTDSGIVVDFTNVEKIKNTLQFFLDMKQKGQLEKIYKFNNEEINKFNRKNTTQKLAEIIIKRN